MKNLFLIPVYLITMCLFVACQTGKQGDPGPAGSSGVANLITGYITVSSWAGSSVSGWGSGNKYFKLPNSNSNLSLDTNSSVKIYLLKDELSSNTLTRSEYPVPYTDLSTNISYSYYTVNYFTLNSSGAPSNVYGGQINFTINNSPNVPGQKVYKFCIIPPVK